MGKLERTPAEPRYGRIASRFWHSRRRHRWNDSTSLLAAYLLSCDHHMIEGLFRLPVSYVSADLAWSAEKVHEGLRRLYDDRFLIYHVETEVVLLPNALKYQVPKGDNQIRGCLRRLSSFEEHPFFPYFLRFAHLHTVRLDVAFHEELTNWFDPDYFEDYTTNGSHTADKYLLEQPPRKKAGLNGHLDGRPDERSTAVQSGVGTLNLNPKQNLKAKHKQKRKRSR